MLTRRSHLLNLARLAPALALASLFSAGCVDGSMNAESDSGLSGIELPSDMDSLDADTVAAEALYMRRAFDSNRANERLGFMKLDLADDMQYRYLVHRMALSGKSPESSPRLFEGIKKMRAAHLARHKVEVALDDEEIGTTQQALESDPCGLFLETPVESTAADSTVTSQSHVNCFGGTAFPYGYTDVATYETDAAESYLVPLGYTATETYNGAEDFSTSALAASLAVNVGKVHFIDGISYTEDSSGNPYSTYSYFKTMAKNKAAALIVQHPYDVNGDGVRRNCIKRGAYVGNGDCDYAAVDASGVPSQAAVGVAKMVQDTSGQWRAASEASNRWFPPGGIAQFEDLYLPLDGTFDAGTNSDGDCNITDFVAASTKVVMTLKGGGWCIGGLAGSAQNLEPFRNELQANINGKQSSFHMLANFGHDCLALATGSANTEKVKISVQIKAITGCGSDAGNANKPILNIDYKDSCFAKGTGILRADGRYVAVEKLKVGELVQSTQSGTPLTVVSISRGGEGKPLVQLLDSSGHSVLLTETHPVITSGGVVPADQVQIGYQIESEDGPAEVVGVERVVYKDLVYNLTLGTPEELSRVSANDRTMFAGGIRVGDNAMQLDLHRSGVAAPRGVAPEWKKDYDAAVARKANLHTP